MIVGGLSVLLADTVHPIEMYDLVYIPPLTWHQFQPEGDEPLGFSASSTVNGTVPTCRHPRNWPSCAPIRWWRRLSVR
ncbi:MAG: hypothetical protein R2838_10885 [Caldilineaceae bacterium]